MKRVNLLCTAAALLLGVSSFAGRAASPIKLGIKGGVLLSSASLKYDSQGGAVRYDKTSSRPGYELGLQMRVQLPGGFLVQPEVLFTHTKGVFPTDPSQVGVSGVSVKSNYIDVPVLVGWRFLGLVRVMAGPSFRFPTNHMFSTAGFDPRLKNFVLGFQAGAGIDLGRFTFDARYCANLTEITDGGVSLETIKGFRARERHFAFSLGYMLLK